MAQLPTLCAEASAYVGEPLAGTAAFATTWIFVEESGPWAAQPLESPGLAKMRPALEDWLSSMPNARLQLIRRAQRKGSSRLLFIAEPAKRKVRRFEAEDITSVDLSGGDEVSEPLFFVCTHGKRDQCCARWGVELFKAFDTIVGERVWQTSHLGGHRFAPTLLSLPHGYCYGRVESSEVALIAAGEQLLLPRLRGRVCYRVAVQAGEIALRQSMNLEGFEDVRVLRISHNESEWRVRFEAGSKKWLVRVRPEITGTLRAKSCGGELDAVQVFPCIIEAASR